MIDSDLWLVDNEEMPQVFDQWLGEEGFALPDVVLFENFVA